MKVRDLREALEGLTDDTEVLLYDGDSGDHYVSQRVEVGFARHTHYNHSGKWQSESWIFEKSLKQVGLSKEDMELYSIEWYDIVAAVVIE